MCHNHSTKPGAGINPMMRLFKVTANKSLPSLVSSLCLDFAALVEETASLQWFSLTTACQCVYPPSPSMNPAVSFFATASLHEWLPTEVTGFHHRGIHVIDSAFRFGIFWNWFSLGARVQIPTLIMLYRISLLYHLGMRIVHFFLRCIQLSFTTQVSLDLTLDTFID